jgi:SAM-dependent methyltransferase
MGLKTRMGRIARSAKRAVFGPPEPELGRVTPTGDTYYGEKAETYLRTRQNTENWKREHEVMVDLLSDLPDGLSVLDVPFGIGRFVPEYLAKDMIVHGIDSSREMLGLASSYLGAAYARCHVVEGDATDLPYDHDSFDLVVCFRFLNQIVSLDDARLVLNEIHRVARSSAFLQLKARREDAPRVPYPGPGEMMSNRLYRSDLDSLVEAAGFSIDHVGTITRSTNHRLAYLVRKSGRPRLPAS